MLFQGWAADVSTWADFRKNWCASHGFVKQQSEDSTFTYMYINKEDRKILLVDLKTYLGKSPTASCCRNAWTSNSVICAFVELFANTTSFTRPDLSNASIALAGGTLSGSTHLKSTNFLVRFLDLVGLDAIVLAFSRWTQKLDTRVNEQCPFTYGK